MYNMDITILGYKIKLEILILIGVIYLILVGHTVCGCCNFYSLIEGNTTMSRGNANTDSETTEEGQSDESKTKMKEMISQEVKAQMQQKKQGGTAEGETTTTTGTRSRGNMPTQTTATEGFVGANINYGQSSPYELGDTMPVDTSSWSAQSMVVEPGKPLSKGVKDFLARPNQQLPLPEGEMVFLANSQFKPECCPNTYSNSSGCWCGSSADFNYLKTRAGNNVPYSEY